MKYEAPKFDMVELEASDIITASKDVEIEESADNSGKILIGISSLFGK